MVLGNPRAHSLTRLQHGHHDQRQVGVVCEAPAQAGVEGRRAAVPRTCRRRQTKAPRAAAPQGRSALAGEHGGRGSAPQHPHSHVVPALEPHLVAKTRPQQGCEPNGIIRAGFIHRHGSAGRLRLRHAAIGKQDLSQQETPRRAGVTSKPGPAWAPRLGRSTAAGKVFSTCSASLPGSRPTCAANGRWKDRKPGIDPGQMRRPQGEEVDPRPAASCPAPGSAAEGDAAIWPWTAEGFSRSMEQRRGRMVRVRCGHWGQRVPLGCHGPQAAGQLADRRPGAAKSGARPEKDETEKGDTR